MQKLGGGEIEVDINTIHFKTRYVDEYTGNPLPNHLVRVAMVEEMPYCSTFVRMRWALCSKGYLEEPDVRARLVACEVAKDKSSAFHASTPPLERQKGAVLKVRRTANPGWPTAGVVIY